MCPIYKLQEPNATSTVRGAATIMWVVMDVVSQVDPLPLSLCVCLAIKEPQMQSKTIISSRSLELAPFCGMEDDSGANSVLHLVHL